MKLGEPDKSGRPRPIKIPGSEFIMELDTVVEVLGIRPNRLFLDKVPGFERTRWETLEVDEKLETSIKGVFAGGGCNKGKCYSNSCPW